MINRKVDEKLWELLIGEAVSENLKENLNNLPSEAELRQELSFSPGFDLRIRRTIRQQKQKAALQRLPSIAKKAAMFVVMVFSGAAALLMTTQPVQAAVRQVIVDWFDEYTSFTFTESREPEEELLLVPSYLPEGYTLSSCSYTPFGNILEIEYEEIEDPEILIRYSFETINNGSSWSIDNEHNDYQQIEVNGNPGYLFVGRTEEDESFLAWTQDDYFCMLMAERADYRELITMAESLEYKNFKYF